MIQLLEAARLHGAWCQNKDELKSCGIALVAAKRTYADRLVVSATKMAWRPCRRDVRRQAARRERQGAAGFAG